MKTLAKLVGTAGFEPTTPTPPVWFAKSRILLKCLKKPSFSGAAISAFFGNLRPFKSMAYRPIGTRGKIKNWLNRLPIWKTPDDNIATEIWRAFWFFVLLSVAGVIWERVQAQEMEMADSHGWQTEMGISTPGPKLIWDRPVQVRFYGKENIDQELKYAIWSWSERTGHSITFEGRTEYVPEGASRLITVRIVSALDIQEITNNVFTKGNTRYWFYPDVGFMAGAVISLNDLYFLEDGSGKTIVDDCAMQTIVHEIGHALGALHTDSNQDVMWPYGASGCRYTLSPGDIAATHYGAHGCFAQPSMTNDLYLPDIHGKSAALSWGPGDIWHLESLEDAPANLCEGSKVDESLNLTIPDIRTEKAVYRAAFDYIGHDNWRLNYAE